MTASMSRATIRRKQNDQGRVVLVKEMVVEALAAADRDADQLGLHISEDLFLDLRLRAAPDLLFEEVNRLDLRTGKCFPH